MSDFACGGAFFRSAPGGGFFRFLEFLGALLRLSLDDGGAFRFLEGALAAAGGTEADVETTVFSSRVLLL